MWGARRQAALPRPPLAGLIVPGHVLSPVQCVELEGARIAAGGHSGAGGVMARLGGERPYDASAVVVLGALCCRRRHYPRLQAP